MKKPAFSKFRPKTVLTDKSHPKRIHTLLSTSFLLLLTLLLLLTALVFSIVQYQTLRRMTLQNLEQISDSVNESLSQQIKHMDSVLLNVTSSYDLQNTFNEYMSDDLTIASKTKLKRELSSNLLSARGYDFSIRQLNMYSVSKGCFGVGDFTGDLPAAASEQAWYSDVCENKGALFISMPSPDPLLSSHGGTSNDTMYFSLCRMYYTRSHVASGFIEIKEYYDDVFRLALRPDSTYNPSIYVYDKTGRLLYPILDDDTEIYDYFSCRTDKDNTIKNDLTGKREHVCYSVSDDYGFVVAAAMGHSEFIYPIIRSIALVFPIFLVIFLFCLYISSHLSRMISIPIRSIYRFLSDTTKEQFQEINMEESGIVEIDKLLISINENIRTQKASTEAIILLKEQEIQAQMLALQSQMNPHFLYNSLTAIAEMAKEGMTEQATGMCRDITEILRYISSNKEQYSVLEEELELCDLYLKCMKRRFGDDLIYSFDIDDDLLDCKIPKLCIQLILENAIKFTTKQLPPWKITILGEVDGDIWKVTLRDNGPGFDAEISKNLKENMDKILANGLLPSLQIEGMGILNIFIRLYILYGGSFCFDFGNSPEGGAFVTIGGPINVSE